MMFLYELAIELDRRSADVGDAALALGFGPLSAPSMLDSAQVHALRAHFASVGGPGLSPPTQLSPATWGPPVFEAPPPPPPPAPAPVSSDGGSGPRFSRAQLAILAGVGVLVAGLFGYMVTNSGPDASREQQLAAEARADDQRPEPTVVTTATTAPATTTTALNRTVPRDEAVFCEGGLVVAAIDLRLAAAVFDQDFAELSELAVERRDEWRSSLDLMAMGAPAMHLDEIDQYRSGYEQWFDAIASSSSIDAASAKVTPMALARASNAGQEFGRQIGFYCG